MSTTERVALAAHLHVVLRRKTGRVTDVEWMAANTEYAAEIVRFARLKAVEDNAPELAEWADKLERVMAVPLAVRTPPLVERAATALRERPAPAPAPAEARSSGFGRHSGFFDSRLPGDAPDDEPPAPRYVGGIR
eukprot:Opistho-2@6469